LIGLFQIDSILPISEIPARDWHQNAHTRKSPHYGHDIVVKAARKTSGRLQQCIPIGSYRNGAYRVRPDLLKQWGGLSVNDGFIQRSAVPPRFLNAARFYQWFKKQKPCFVEGNFS